jgi:long-chain acyl-CoA synthetase
MAMVLPFYGFFNVAVLEPVRLSAGGSLKATISGGGALPVEIDRFFNYIGIPVLEGYGMTETSPVIAVR